VNKITLIFSKKILFGFWSLILTMGCFLYGRVGVAKTSVIGYLVGLFLYPRGQQYGVDLKNISPQ